MIFQKSEFGLFAISQPAHALLAGQLARAWGNSGYSEFKPHLEVLQATDLHDIGWTAWEQNPTLNPKTKLPYGFDELPLEEHLQLFTNGPEQVLTIGRYQALLVSLHGSSLYNRGIYTPPSAAHQERVDRFLLEQNLFQQKLLTSLKADKDYAQFCEPETISYNQQVIQFCDWLSLYICLGIFESQDFPAVALHDKQIDFKINAVDGNPRSLKMSPWPFKKETVQLICDARILEESYQDEKQMRDSLKKVEVKTIQTTLSCEK